MSEAHNPSTAKLVEFGKGLSYLTHLTQFMHACKRKKATLRTCSKKGRHVQKVLNVIESYFVPIPELCEKVTYDTGLRKRGASLVLGDD